MRHLRSVSTSRHQPNLPQPAALQWCDGKADGFCYSFEIQDGAFGILGQGGITGELERFIPLLPIAKAG